MKKVDKAEKQDHGKDDEVVCVLVNGTTFYVSPEDAVTILRILGRAEARQWQYKNGSGDGYYTVGPAENSIVSVHNANLTELMQERIAYENHQTEKLLKAA